MIQDSHVDQNAIRARAYKLWQDRGCPAGSPEHDWFSAEREFMMGGNRQASHTELDFREHSSEEPMMVCETSVAPASIDPAPAKLATAALASAPSKSAESNRNSKRNKAKSKGRR
jgi:hypothetical protein